MIDNQKTREYYSKVLNSDLCHCAYCQNYIQEIKLAYPDVDRYLESIGVDIEKPFETMPLDPDENGHIVYIAALYIVMGSPDGFETLSIKEVEVRIAQSYPSTNSIGEEHFVIELSPITLNWEMNTFTITRKRTLLVSAIVPFWVIPSKITKRQFMEKHNWTRELCEHDKKGQAKSRIDLAELDNIGIRIKNGQTIEVYIPKDTVSIFASTMDGSLSNEILVGEITENQLTITTKGGFKTVSYPHIETKQV